MARRKLMMTCELVKRIYRAEGTQEKKHIRSPADVYNLVRPDLMGKGREHLLALYLDTKNNVRMIKTISIGSLNANIVHPREVFKPAVEMSICNVILVHNHPSGDPKPSREDIAVTEKVKSAGELLGIALLDHVVIGDGAYCSLKDESFI